MQNSKMGNKKKGFNERIALAHVKKQKDDKKISRRGMMIKSEETFEHKKHKQKGKVVIISLLPPKALGRWPYAKWN